ncbi:hypothetical protein J4462_04380 [Candidatus Pacearchaeota archaeon]|nr:hypothetical protein [Candidatus Pacearchaeota archaeon]
MPVKYRENIIGAWAFLVGIVLAIFVGFFSRSGTNPVILGVLALLGLVLGFFVAEKDVQTFLFASLSVVLASFAGIQGMAADVSMRGVTLNGVEIGRGISSILGALLFLYVPSTIVVALKTVFAISKN